MATLEQIQTRMKKLQAQAEVIIARRAQNALDQIRELMLKHGLTTRDIEARAKARRERDRAERLGLGTTGKLKSAGATKGKLPPKYRDPKTGATWSGHARPPAWIKNVKDRSKFLIDGGSAAVELSATVKPAAKKTARKTAGRQAAAGKTPAKKAAAKKTAVKKTAAKKVAAKKTVGRKAAAKKATSTRTAAAGKTAARKATAKKAARKPAARKTAARKTAPRAAAVAAPVTGNGAITLS
jgi:DNA-binding protein H-NS